MLEENFSEFFSAKRLPMMMGVWEDFMKKLLGTINRQGDKSGPNVFFREMSRFLWKKEKNQKTQFFYLKREQQGLLTPLKAFKMT